jgi:hypothetical protein
LGFDVRKASLGQRPRLLARPKYILFRPDYDRRLGIAPDLLTKLVSMKML